MPQELVSVVDEGGDVVNADLAGQQQQPEQGQGGCGAGSLTGRRSHRMAAPTGPEGRMVRRPVARSSARVCRHVDSDLFDPRDRAQQRPGNMSTRTKREFR